jgi:hypothetical protein
MHLTLRKAPGEVFERAMAILNEILLITFRPFK